MIEKNENIKNKLALLPDTPGVYQYFDKTGKIIYVGKAKNLKRRVSSYFNKVHDSAKTNMLVKNIYDLQYIVVKTEEDALHLENSLIKEYKPRYNVLLKDDKTYPWICLRNEHFPRVFLTRRVNKDGSKYYGPYANVHLAKTVLALIRELYPIRTCNYALTPENIAKKRFRVCLQYHIKNCKGCCEGKISEQEYDGYIEQVRQILNGDIHQLSRHLLEEMQSLSAELRFEEAQAIKEKYDLIEKYKAKSVIVNPSLHEIDVFSYDEDEGVAFVNYMHVRGGSIVQSITIEYKKKLDESAPEILSLGIAELRSRFGSKAREALVPFLPESSFDDVEFVVPQRGDKKKLLAVSEQNVKQYKIDRLKQNEKLNPEQRVMRVLSRIQQDFRLPELPWHMECFDNSNIQGTNPVASCVVFKKGRPSKKDYRHFDIKTVVGPDDFASMREIIYRRRGGAAPVDHSRWRQGAVECRTGVARGVGPAGQGTHRGYCQAVGRNLFSRRFAAALYRQKFGVAAGDSAHARRGSPVRYNLPPQQAEQGAGEVGSRFHCRNRAQNPRCAVDALQECEAHQRGVGGRFGLGGGRGQGPHHQRASGLIFI